MGANAFEDASGMVVKLKAQFDHLTKELPKLRELKKVADQELSELNQTLVAKQGTLDTIIEQIKTQTETFNTWQRAQMKEVTDAKTTFAAEKANSIKELDAREVGLIEREKALATAQTALKTAEATHTAKIAKDQQDIDSQVRVNNEWARRLNEQETTQKKQGEDVTALANKIGTRTMELDQREVIVANAEKTATEHARSAEQDRKVAKQLLYDAKERIANTDAREDALEMRKRTLDTREQGLNKKEVALNDQRNVLISNGLID